MVALTATGACALSRQIGQMLKTSSFCEPAYTIHGPDRPRRWLVTCDHASNAVPGWVGDLGVPAADMERHIAWDVGAAGLSVALADRLGCPCILSGFSRLVIDPNRGEDDPTLIMRLYDGSVVPGNLGLSPADIAARIERLYRAYHAELAGLCDAGTAIVAMHSYTPALRGRPPRPWQVGILYSHRDERLSRRLLARLKDEPDLCVGDNQPYSGHLPGDSIDRHALAQGRHNTLVEVRNDLIGSALDQEGWANRLAVHLALARDDLGI